MTQTTTLKDQAARTADTPVNRGSTTAGETQDLTDGFHLVIDAFKLNGIDTIYGVPGIPITDFGVWRRRRVFASSRSDMSRTPVTPLQSPAS